jgi:RNA polymerase sigma-70 factor (ECF subfamily)
MHIVSPSDGPEKLALNSELRVRLEESLDRLPDNLKTAVLLRDIHGMSNREAAAVLEISVSSLKARLHRGLVLLRRHLQDYLEPG